MTGLRPVEPRDVAALTAWVRDPVAAGEHQWFGFRSGHRLEQAVTEGTTITDDSGWLAVVDDSGALLGSVQWFPRPGGPTPGTHAFMIGVLLLPEHRGKGHGSAAQRLLAAYLFDHYPVERVEAGTDVDNVAEQRALDRAGFTQEGRLRRSQWRAGAWHDTFLYSKLRGEP